MAIQITMVDIIWRIIMGVCTILFVVLHFYGWYKWYKVTKWFKEQLKDEKEEKQNEQF